MNREELNRKRDERITFEKSFKQERDYVKEAKALAKKQRSNNPISFYRKYFRAIFRIKNKGNHDQN
ncbi:hypothetical protein SAMN06298216_1847 [Spirosomataceae bacterium TFI 002]|nr:hypothetical protein SAMN06298216_1847 [Spirosomataceae bacterium TFI 002]